MCGGDVMDPQGEFKERVPQTNLVMANLGDLKFEDATPGAGPDFSTKKAVHRGGPSATSTTTAAWTRWSPTCTGRSRSGGT